MKSCTDVKRFLVGWAAVLALLVCLIVLTGYRGSVFMSGSNVVNILRAMAIDTVLGVVATTIMAPDGFDTSVGILASCSAYVFVSVYLQFGMSLGMSIIACIFATLAMYRLTMFLILVYEIPDMPVTCTLMFVHQSIDQWYIGGGAVPMGMRAPRGAMPACTALSESFSAIGRVSWIIIIMLGCVSVAYLFFNSTKHGHYFYTMGENKEAAKLPGIDVKKYRYLVGMITAVFIAVGSILVTPRGSSAQVMRCDNHLTPSLAAVSVGHIVSGVKKPNALGTMIGAMLVSTLESGLTVCAVPSYVLSAIEGAVLAPALTTVYAPKRED